MIATVIICIFIGALVVLGIRNIRKRISAGCCGGGDAPAKKIRVGDRDPRHYPYEKTVQITGMHCRNCAIRVQNALNSTAGVLAQVDLGSGMATVRMKEEFPDSTLRRAVESAGYSVRSIRAVPLPQG